MSPDSWRRSRECLSRVTGRVTGVYTCPGQVVIRLEDGTVSSLMSVEFRGPDTETMERVLRIKRFLQILTILTTQNQQKSTQRKEDLLRGHDLSHPSLPEVKQNLNGENSVTNIEEEEASSFRSVF